MPTGIEWTHVPGYTGETWNPVTGCNRISPGCGYCYARTMAKRLKAMGQPGYQRDGDGPGFGVSMHREKLDDPMRWRKPRAVFVNSMSDLFHEEIDEGNVRDIYSTMARCPQHIFMVLTKRPERARELYRRGVLASRWVTEWPLPNVWLGVSIENARFTWRADVLREIPAAVRFISAEPLLGSLVNAGVQRLGRRETLDAANPRWCDRCANGVMDAENVHVRGTCRCACHPNRPLDLTGIDWILIGGESGAGARPFHLEHAREIINAGHLHRSEWRGGGLSGHTGPSLFVKQLGARPITSSGEEMRPWLSDRKGGDWDEWPADLRIREFPDGVAVPA